MRFLWYPDHDVSALWQRLVVYIYLFNGNCATDGSLTCAILSFHVELSKYSTTSQDDLLKRNVNAKTNALHH